MKNSMNDIVPKYYIVKCAIIEKIQNHELNEDDMLPSEKDLMDAFGVSRITVRRALDELVVEGYIYKIQGKGTFVKRTKQGNVPLSKKLISCSEEIRSQNMIPSRRVLHKVVIPADDRTAETLQIEIGEPVLWFERIYYADNVPMNYADSIINLKYFPGLEKYDLEKMSMLSIVNDIYKCDVERSYRIIEAISAGGNLAKKLQVKDGFPLLQVKSVSNCTVNGENVPFEINTSCYRTDIIRFSLGEY